MRLEKFLGEARSNPDKNVKTSIVTILRPYSTKEDYYIHFTDINKLGINPKQSYNTPLGIYTYPLKEMWGEVEEDRIPFNGNCKYVFLIKNTGKLLDVDSYKNLTGDINKLEKMYKKEYGNSASDSIVLDAEYRMRELYSDKSKFDKHIEDISPKSWDIMSLLF